MTKDLFEQLPEKDAAAIAFEMQRLQLSNDTIQQILHFCSALRKYNEHTNLVANANLDVVLKEHVLDSLSLLPFIPSDTEAKLIDIGSGAGFPGMILAIALPGLKVVLAESIGKKCRFLETTRDELGLDQHRVVVICDRAENLAHQREYRECFDYATARAVAALPIVAELSLPFLKLGGKLLAQRSKRQALEEQNDSQTYIEKLGGKILGTEFLPEDLVARQLAIFSIEKQKPTPKGYPRAAAQIQKEKKAKRSTQ